MSTLKSPSGRAPHTGIDEPVVLSPRVLRQWPLPQPDSEGDKEERGRALVVGGSTQMPGAVILAATAALRAGAGKLRIATGKSLSIAVGAAVPESRVYAMPETGSGGISPDAADAILDLARQAQAMVIGPGMVDDAAVDELVRRLLGSIAIPLVLDAGALLPLADCPELLKARRGEMVITPHEGEMAHLCGTSKESISADRTGCAIRNAQALGAVVVLKGRETIIAGPDGLIYVNRTGNVGLATSGSGDTLAGVIAGLMARGAPAIQAAAWGVFLHASAGDRLAKKRGRLGYLAREIPDEIPALMEG